MTNQQGVPEALRLADALECRTTSWPDKVFAAAELRRLHAENVRLAAMVEAQQHITHVQNPAEIEHVAGDVSKNGPESNTAQRPAPSAHIKEPYTLAEIKAKIASNDYGAEMLLQHAMLLLDSASLAASAGSEPVAWTTGLNWRTDTRCQSEMVVKLTRKSQPEYGFTQPLYTHPSPPEGTVGVWQDIATAPKDGTRFVAVGNNYGLYSETQHVCIAQWFRGCWMEASDWNEASELKYLTHWMPLPPLPGSAARAPADSVTAPAAGAVAHTISDAQIEAMPVWRNFVGLWPESRREIVDAVVDLLTTPPAKAADSVLEDAARWKMAVLVGNEVMMHPEKRTHPAAVKAYMDAVHSGLDLTGAIDAARKQGANHD